MSIKEKPLIDAVERLGPLPAFLFAHPVFAGFFAMVMCAVFGVVATGIWGLFGSASQTYHAARIGAYVLVAFASTVFIGIFFNAFREPEEILNRLQFVLGGVLGLAFFVAADLLTVDYFSEQLGTEFLICTSIGYNCN